MENENLGLSAEEKLKKLNDERKVLKAQVSSERETRLKEAASMREARDKKQEVVKEKLSLILKAIFSFNKLGKGSKDQCEILQTIVKLAENPLNEEDTAMAEAEELNK